MKYKSSKRTFIIQSMVMNCVFRVVRARWPKCFTSCSLPFECLCSIEKKNVYVCACISVNRKFFLCKWSGPFSIRKRKQKKKKTPQQSYSCRGAENVFIQQQQKSKRIIERPAIDRQRNDREKMVIKKIRIENKNAVQVQVALGARPSYVCRDYLFNLEI